MDRTISITYARGSTSISPFPPLLKAAVMFISAGGLISKLMQTILIQKGHSSTEALNTVAGVHVPPCPPVPTPLQVVLMRGFGMRASFDAGLNFV